jgi:hypothetical protein
MIINTHIFIKPSTSKLNIFLYEVDMMNNTCDLIQFEQDKYKQNAFLESFLLHTRNLIDFLSDNRRYQSDLTCTDFLDKKGNKISRIELAFDAEFKASIDKHLSHITKERTKKKPSWNYNHIKHLLNQSVNQFVDLCTHQ